MPQIFHISFLCMFAILKEDVKKCPFLVFLVNEMFVQAISEDLKRRLKNIRAKRGSVETYPYVTLDFHPSYCEIIL